MDPRRSRFGALIVLDLLAIFGLQFSNGLTNEADVYAINNLYIALGSPPIPGWVSTGGDPCAENWQGVKCIGSNISSITLNGANLGGRLGDKLENFSSIMTIDLSNNHIGGNIPSNLPTTIKTFFLSDNQFTGSIPDSLSTLTLLTDMSLNNNLLTGELPDSFQMLSGLINLDLSFNNLSGRLPQSFEGLSLLTTLHVQNNQLTGTLDVLQDLPLKDLNIEDNLFMGPVPDKILSIPKFKKDGNPLNTTVAPSSPPQIAPPVSEGPTLPASPGKSAAGPASPDGSRSKGSRKSQKTIRTVAFVTIGIILSVVIILLAVLLIRYCEKKSRIHKSRTKLEAGSYKMSIEKPKGNASRENIEAKKAPVPEEVVQKARPQHHIDTIGLEKVVQKPLEEHDMEMAGTGVIALSPPAENVTGTAIVLAELPKDLDIPTSAITFKVGSLQQYTNSFSPESLIGVGMLGSTYRAELPDGKLLAVKKLDNASPLLQTEESFLNLVSSVANLQHANIVKLVGFCAEHKQRLLVYEFCSGGTLHDVIHSGDELNKKLSWNARIRIALGAARALEYLHEVCQPPVIHRNFKTANLLLDDEVTVRASDCGLASLISSGSVKQLSGNILSSLGYGAPEFTRSGTYTCQSDVYSFGVIMLELLTGRKSYDSSLPRGEQHLARWAINQLHDIASLSRMVDPSLCGNYPEKSLSRFADIISVCVQSEPEFRPPMSEIVQKLLRMMPREPSSRRSNGGSSSSSS